MLLVMPPKITGWDLNEHKWECDWVFWGSSSLLSSPTSSSVRVCGGSGGGTDTGTYASSSSFLSYLLFLWMLWMNVALKATGQHFAWSGPISLSWELLLLLLLGWEYPQIHKSMITCGSQFTSCCNHCNVNKLNIPRMHWSMVIHAALRLPRAATIAMWASPKYTEVYSYMRHSVYLVLQQLRQHPMNTLKYIVTCGTPFSSCCNHCNVNIPRIHWSI